MVRKMPLIGILEAPQLHIFDFFVLPFLDIFVFSKLKTCVCAPKKKLFCKFSSFFGTGSSEVRFPRAQNMRVIAKCSLPTRCAPFKFSPRLFNRLHFVLSISLTSTFHDNRPKNKNLLLKCCSRDLQRFLEILGKKMTKEMRVGIQNRAKQDKSQSEKFLDSLSLSLSLSLSIPSWMDVSTQAKRITLDLHKDLHLSFLKP